jgi:V-type H+-transporting ATPase 16kDa proteolipid subunit
LVFSCLGAAYGTAKSGVGVSSTGILRPDLVMKLVMPVILAGALAIYGVVVSVVINGAITETDYPAYLGYHHFAAGLSCGLSCLAAGMAIGIVGDAGVRATGQQPRLFVSMCLMLIFAEALGLYGLIVAMVLGNKAAGQNPCGTVA